MCSKCDLGSEQQERLQERAIALLNIALAPYDEEQRPYREATEQMEAMMGQTIQTRGCSKCQGTMYKTVDTDENGNPTNESQFICVNCGNME